MRAQLLSTKAIFEGFLTFLPGLKNLLDKKTGGNNSAKYCYSVWLRHYSKIFQTMKRDLPCSHVAELGPGDSLGAGIAALFSGCESYTAIDAVQHFNTETNLAVLHDIYELFQLKHPIPGPDEFPLVKPLITTYAFPSFHISNSKHISVEYKKKIIKTLKNFNQSSSPISFLPAHSIESHNNASKFDLIFSQAVLEHVDDLPRTYAMCNNLIKLGGLMSHTIDFKCHGVSSEWNGHWTYSPFLWRVLLGRRAYFINRKPLSYHLKQLDAHGFDIILLEIFHQHSIVTRNDLAKEFRSLTEEDLQTSGAYILAQKRF
jgi:hypothetical protein